MTATLLCRLLGGTAAGAAADRWGRRPVLMASILMMALCDGAIAFAPSLAWVLGLRVLFGFAMGAEWTAGATMAMENWVVPLWGWRGLFLLAAAPALLVIPVRFLAREAPRAAADEAALPSSWRDLARPGLRRRVAWATLVLLLGFGVYYALVASYPALLRRELGLPVPAVGAVVAWFNVGMLCGAATPPLVAWLAESGTGLSLAGSTALVVVVLQTLLAGVVLLAPLPAPARAGRAYARGQPVLEAP